MSRKPMRRASASVWIRVRPSSLTAEISATVAVVGSSPAGPVLEHRVGGDPVEGERHAWMVVPAGRCGGGPGQAGGGDTGCGERRECSSESQGLPPLGRTRTEADSRRGASACGDVNSGRSTRPPPGAADQGDSDDGDRDVAGKGRRRARRGVRRHQVRERGGGDQARGAGNEHVPLPPTLAGRQVQRPGLRRQRQASVRWPPLPSRASGRRRFGRGRQAGPPRAGAVPDGPGAGGGDASGAAGLPRRGRRPPRRRRPVGAGWPGSPSGHCRRRSTGCRAGRARPPRRDRVGPATAAAAVAARGTTR